IERAREGILADAIIDHVNALAVGDLLRPRDEILSPVVDHVRATVILRELALLRRACGADDSRPQMLRPLTGYETDAAGSRVQEHGRFGTDLVSLFQEIADRHSLQHHGGGRLIVDAVRDLDHAIGGNEPLLRVGTDGAGIGDPVAYLEVGHTGTDGGDLARAFRSDHRGQADLVQALAMIRVDVIESYRTVLEANLPFTWLADVDLLPFHDLRAAMLMNSNCVHHGSFPRELCCEAQPTLASE